jgi:putative addiction module CopG family antidote
MVPRNVTLSDDQVALIEALIGSGRYATADQVLNEALLLLDDERMVSDGQLEELMRAVAVGEADVAAGRVTILRSAAERRAFVEALGRRG